jgi:hypothetical protein
MDRKHHKTYVYMKTLHRRVGMLRSISTQFFLNSDKNEKQSEQTKGQLIAISCNFPQTGVGESGYPVVWSFLQPEAQFAGQFLTQSRVIGIRQGMFKFLSVADEKLQHFIVSDGPETTCAEIST